MWLIKPHPISIYYAEKNIVKNYVKSINSKNLILCPNYINNEIISHSENLEIIIDDPSDEVNVSSNEIADISSNEIADISSNEIGDISSNDLS